MLEFNRGVVLEGLHSGWAHLYDRKAEDSWKVLIGQVERIRNLYVLDLASRKVSASDLSAYWKHLGRIEALDALHSTVHSELSSLKKEQDSHGKLKNNEEKVMGPRRHRRSPSISL